uniref:Uncharacterized protein n=1 Tax=Avena sativa TaxID=4498 RepID=A0ACD5Z7A9_AVESA
MSSGAGSCLALVVMILVVRASPAAATSFTVGDKSGWTLGVDYTTWASGNTFKVGDNLVFNYAKGQHTVVEVSAADYLACAAANPLGSDSSGASTVLLKTAGKHYFICTITGHCAGGMKLEVTVSGSGGSSSPSSPTPTPRTPTTPYTSPTPTTPYTTPTTPYTMTPTSPACTGTTPGATPVTPVTPGTMPYYYYNGAAGLAPVAWATFAMVCAAIVQVGLL